MRFRRIALAFIITVLAVASWVGVAIVLGDPAVQVMTWPGRGIALALFVLAPALTFIPLARLAQIALLEWEAMLGWGMLLYLLAFVDPQRAPRLPALVVFLVSLTVAVASLLTLIVFVFGSRIAAWRGQRYDALRARAVAYLTAFFFAGCLLLRELEAFTLTNVRLLALIVLLVQVLVSMWLTPRVSS
ncbi:hypothetical protein [Thermorudis peleae]|uniref:hypothetical protein n=1 Tax=Thermorudis peleae TaxID=1382356 RepID=UPI00056DDC56|nr:hypothetical protein [Thermorudis peleae]